MANSKHLLALTACPSGVAHTYMAAEQLAAAAADKGYTMDVETHGSIGVEGTFSQDSIDRADAVIVAADKDIELTRFAGKPVLVTKVADGIHRPGALIDEALAAPPLKGQQKTPATGGKQSIGGGIYKALMNGVSHMIPFVVAGGLLLALAFSIGGTPTEQGLVIPETSLWYTVMQVGSLAFSLMVPILSGFIASAIADRPGLAPGLVTGFIAVTPALYHSEAGAGFLGGIVTGFLSGYVALAIKKIPVHRLIAPIWPIIVIPVFTTVIVGGIFIFGLGFPIAAFFTWLTQALSGMTGSAVVLLGLLLGAMIGFDMGGPVNKVAFLFAGGLIATGATVPMGMVGVAIATPPIGMGIATLIRRHYFTAAERENGIAAIFMGFFGITEGAIPFAAARPLQVIPANVIGSAVGAAVAGLFAVGNNVMWGGGIVAILGAVNKPLQFFIALAVGVAVNAAVALVLLGWSDRRKNQPVGVAGKVSPAVVNSAAEVASLTEDSEPKIASAPVAQDGGPAFVEYLDPRAMLFDQAFSDRDEVIRVLAERGVATGQLNDAAGVLASAQAREQLGTTAVGKGLAIPHAKCDSAVRPFLGFARINDGIDWDAKDGAPVRLAFLIAVPEAAAGNEHLKILAGLARALMHDDVRTALLNANSAEEVYEALRGNVKTNAATTASTESTTRKAVTV